MRKTRDERSRSTGGGGGPGLELVRATARKTEEDVERGNMQKCHLPCPENVESQIELMSNN
jgi:hypothetical protein